jgi:hypothetical protein
MMRQLELAAACIDLKLDGGIGIPSIKQST